MELLYKITERLILHLKKLKAEHLEFIVQKLSEDNCIKSSEIANLLNNGFDMSISERTIQRSLNERGYEYVGLKIKQKISCMIRRTDLIGVIGT